MSRLSAGDISKMLAMRAESFCEHLFPNGKKEGHEYCVGSIFGEAGKSLKIHLTGEKSGVWSDFSTNDKGDLLDLIALNRSVSLVDAIKYARCYLGITHEEIVAYTKKSYVRPKAECTPAEDAHCAVRNYLMQERCLTQDTIFEFAISAKPGAIVFGYFRDDELILVKYLDIERVNGKKKIAVSKDSEPCLYGWQALSPSSREITICEGELDAMSLHQYGISALSVPFGAGNHQWVENEFDRLSIFDKIYICFDSDDAGKKGAAELVERLGRHRCYIVTLPMKDANACLMEGVFKEDIEQCFMEAKTVDPTELKLLRDYEDKIIELFYPTGGVEKGLALPWGKADGKILLRPSELSVWTGINGHGKSMMLGQVILHAAQAGSKICIASLEIKPERLGERMVRQASGLAEPTKGYISEICKWFGEQIYIFDLVGMAKTERLLEVFKYASQRYGVEHFVVDSFMKLDVEEDDYKGQKAFIEKLCDFKNQFNCHVHIVSHPRKSFDETKIPGKMDVAGSGNITNLADNCFVVWRNKSKEDKMNQLAREKNEIDEEEYAAAYKELSEKPDAFLSCDKQRNGDWEGKIWLGYDKASMQYLNSVGQKPRRYVQYSNPIKNEAI